MISPGSEIERINSFDIIRGDSLLGISLINIVGIAYNTAVRAIEQLEHIKVLSPVGDARRDRVICARAILDILEEPARLKPT